MKSFAPLLLAIGLVLFGASCASTYRETDATFAALTKAADANPPSDAIAGMWHRKADGAHVAAKSRTSLLFRPDGTGVARTAEEFTAFGARNMQANLQWTYQGRGRWDVVYLRTPAYPTSWLGARGTLRFSAGQLLLTLHWGDNVLKEVYQRVP